MPGSKQQEQSSIRRKQAGGKRVNQPLLQPALSRRRYDLTIQAKEPYAGRFYLDSALLAIEAINNKNDGLYDDILPETKLEFSVRDGRLDSGVAVIGAFELATSGAHAILGPTYSDPSAAVNDILQLLDVCQIGYSATSSLLTPRPTFARTPAGTGTGGGDGSIAGPNGLDQRAGAGEQRRIRPSRRTGLCKLGSHKKWRNAKGEGVRDF